MKCKICSQDNKKIFNSKILSKYDIEYFHCENCGFLQTEEPYWLEEAYAESINVSDTGYMVRNLFYANRLAILLFLTFGKKGRFLDYAAGYGVFVRLMRDIGFDFYWDDKYTKNLFSSGFEWEPGSKVDAITSFEAFEHFVDPIKEIESLLNISNGIIFSTELHPDPIPEPSDWWYYGLEHGQHISFYSGKTFEYIAQKFSVRYYCLGSLHILTDKNIPKWKLFMTKLSKFGFHNIIARLLNSKTWADHDKMAKTTIK